MEIADGALRFSSNSSRSLSGDLGTRICNGRTDLCPDGLILRNRIGVMRVIEMMVVAVLRMSRDGINAIAGCGLARGSLSRERRRGSGRGSMLVFRDCDYVRPIDVCELL